MVQAYLLISETLGIDKTKIEHFVRYEMCHIWSKTNTYFRK